MVARKITTIDLREQGLKDVATICEFLGSPYFSAAIRFALHQTARMIREIGPDFAATIKDNIENKEIRNAFIRRGRD